MMDTAIFFDRIRHSVFRGRMTPSQVHGTEIILAATEGWTDGWRAYALATAFHETGATMQPIKERGGNVYFTRMYDIKGERPALAKRMGNTAPGDGVRYCGRGFVQITWKSNYRKASGVVGVDLVAEPDRAMEPEIAAKIMCSGMVDGWFTGKKLSHYITKEWANYRGARRIINGTDKADLIAGYALAFEAALIAAHRAARPVGLMAMPEPMPEPVESPVVVVKNDPISTSSRTAQGTVTAGASGLAVAGSGVADMAGKLQEANSQISAGTYIMVIAGVLTIAGAAYAFYARWRDGGGRWPWEKA